MTADSDPNDVKTLYVIDGHAQIFRAYHAIRSAMTSPVTKEPTNATFGFTGMLLKLFRECRPHYVVVAVDAAGDRGTFRSQLDPEYKANREAPPEDLQPQVERIIEICKLFNLPVLGIEGVEADDTIATLCDRLTDPDDVRIRIVSRDKDLQQLLSDRIQMYDIHKDQTIDLATLREDKGVSPEQVVDMLALMGDNVDNIPGVKGVGTKTAAKLISQFGSLDNLLAHTDELTGKLKQNIEAARQRLPLNVQLVQLKHDVPMDFDLEDAAVGSIQYDALRSMFKQLGFNRHLDDLAALTDTAPTKPDDEQSESSGSNAPTKTPDRAPSDSLFFGLDEEAPAPARRKIDADYELIATRQQLDALVKTLRDQDTICIDTETDRLNPMRAKLVGICLAYRPDHGVYIPVRSSNPEEHLDETTVVDALRPILENPEVHLVAQNLKYDLLVLRRAGIRLAKVNCFDTMVASYLVDATRSSHKLDNLSMAYLQHEMIPITELIGSGKKQKSMADLSAASVKDYAAEDADVTLQLRHVLAPKLKQMGLVALFEKLEMPLVQVLAELEYNGITVDPEELRRQNRGIDARIGELADQIIETAGEPFNVDSPRQLAEILFKRLGCTVVKKRKTGPSTDSEVLERIANEQEPPGSIVAALVLEYRMLTKLRSTYLQTLIDAINPETRRIHASFNQTVTATGRLSSSDPNLQNIPIRTELGRQIRKAFVAPEGHMLLSADYSQIELRLLAHLSQDKGLMKAFEQDLDIHRAVAAEVFGVELDEVTAEQRGVAKMVNFGIVYGITPYGLARRLPSGTAGSSVDVARQIIADYNHRYPKINAFLDKCVQIAETRGYVETICKRRRPIPEVKSRNANTAAFGRRIAINTVVQGSAADLIKTAMVRLQQRIESEQRPMKMLLQIHDELVFEIPEQHAETESKIIHEAMIGAIELSVPLKVDMARGKNWFEAK